MCFFGGILNSGLPGLLHVIRKNWFKFEYEEEFTRASNWAALSSKWQCELRTKCFDQCVLFDSLIGRRWILFDSCQGQHNREQAEVFKRDNIWISCCWPILKDGDWQLCNGIRTASWVMFDSCHDLDKLGAVGLGRISFLFKRSSSKLKLKHLF